MNDIINWIVDYFVKNCDAKEDDVKANLDENYLQSGYIDSFQFINMISKIEEDFGVGFDNDLFEDKSFSTVNGLAKIIEKMKRVKSSSP